MERLLCNTGLEIKVSMNIIKITKNQVIQLTRYMVNLDISVFEVDYTLFLINEILYPPTNIEGVIRRQTQLSNSTILYCDNYKTIIMMIIPHTTEDKTYLMLAFPQVAEEMKNDIFELSYNANKISTNNWVSGTILYENAEIANIISETA